jgi:hypothetical protein
VVGGHRTSHSSNSAGPLEVDSNGSATGTVSTLSLQWLLFDFGQRDAVVEAAQQLSIASNIAFTAAHQRVIRDVCLTYYTNAAAQSRVATADEALRNAQGHRNRRRRTPATRRRHRRRSGAGPAGERAGTLCAGAGAGRRAECASLALAASLGVSPLTQLKVADPGRRQLSAATALARPTA